MLRARPRRRRRRCLWSRTRADGCSGLPSGKPRSSKSRGLVRAPAHQPTSRFCVLGIGKGAVCRRQPEGKKTTFLKAKHLPPGRASKLARTYPIRLIDRKRGEDGIRTIARRALACRTECPPRAYIFRSHRADGGHTNANEQPGGRAPSLPRHNACPMNGSMLSCTRYVFQPSTTRNVTPLIAHNYGAPHVYF